MSDNKVADSIGKASMRFILMMGLVSLCGDMAY